MPSLLTHDEFIHLYGERFLDVCRQNRVELELLTLPVGDEARLDDVALASIQLSCFIGMWEADMNFTRRFLGTTLRAPNLKWLHLPNAGIDDPVFHRLLANGVRLTTSSGSTSEPIAQTAIGGMLALARGFPSWRQAQQRHEWSPHRRPPPDLRGQTMVIFGLGSIGNEIARLARAIGLRIVGIRRSPLRADDHVDELVSPVELKAVARAADWLVITCPLTEETRRAIDAEVLALLPEGAHVINVGRGQVVDEAALIAALVDGRVAGAYLDVFEKEPLPAESPLWDLPNVILSPHNSAVAAGNSGRVAEIFFRNLERWLCGERMENEVAGA